MFLENISDVKKLPSEARKYFKLVQNQINLLLHQVLDLQDVNLVNAGTLKPEIDVFEPMKALNLVKNLF